VQGIQVSFQKQSDIGITDATKNIMNKLDEIIESDDSNASYTVLLDQGEYINLAVGSVLQNIIIGGILAIIILFLFLRDVKPTLIVGLAIPISVIAAFMLMYFTNVSLNLVSMGGLALGIGMLVDNSIVVIENIYRMIGEGKSKEEASIQGAKQIAGAITASTLTTVAVFLPIAFIEGFVAEIFISMALTIAYSLGASLIIALTMVPAMASRLLSDKNNKPEGKIIHKLKSVYKTSVLFTLKHKILTVVVILLLLVASFGLVIAKGFVFLPESDEGSISLNVEVTSQTPFALRAQFADELTEILLDYDDIETVSGSINSGAMFGPQAMMGGGGGNSIEFTINLKEDRSRSTFYYEDVVRKVVSDFDFNLVPGMTANNVVETSISAQNSAGNFGGATGVNIKVSGYELLTIESIANDLVDVISDIEGIEKPDNGITQGADNVKITVNKENAMLYGLTSQDVSDNVSILYESLGSFGQTATLSLTLEGVTYTLDLPNEELGGNISFDILGDFNQFLSGVMLFDDETRQMIEDYSETSGQGVYVINAFLPTYQLGDPLVLIINPFLKVNGNNEIEFNPMSADPTLASRALVALSDATPQSVTEIERVTGFATINTDGTNRFVNVTAQIKEGYNVTLVGQDVTRAVNAYLDGETYAAYGGGYRVTLAGENEDILQAVGELGLAALVAILLVYMVMAIQFQSLIYPLIILGTIPLAFTGGMIALLVTNSYLSLVSIMGMIILIGVVVNNGIVLIDYINVLRRNGRKTIDAIVEAGQTRLRPILMTALTTILALSTLAIGIGQGAELLQPMAITAIGGLIYATILTLVFVPVIYAFLNRKKIKEEAIVDAND
ncbi:MAG: efflux RND transporter permease subunit, partial [Acholeplasmataceae bacterium]|nr:efflux RND transporter permease subunit [Acholeplasmataceae bacterium]